MIKIHTKDITVTDVCGAVMAKQDTLATLILKQPGVFLKTLLIWQERASTRARLRDLDAHFLQDVGLSREQARNEARKPFWIG